MISKNVGFEAMFFQRMDYKEKNTRFEKGTRIFEWNYNSNSTYDEQFNIESKKLLTVVLKSYTFQGPFSIVSDWNVLVCAECNHTVSIFNMEIFTKNIKNL